MPLGAIEEEIASIEAMSNRARSLADIQRLAVLRAAKRRIVRGEVPGLCMAGS
jgi:hypothetical protein